MELDEDRVQKFAYEASLEAQQEIEDAIREVVKGNSAIAEQPWTRIVYVAVERRNGDAWRRHSKECPGCGSPKRRRTPWL